MKERISSDTQMASFDLWLTLIKSNGPNFKSVRNDLMRMMIAPDMSRDAFDATVRAQDKLSDQLAETRGQDVLFEERVRNVAASVGAIEPSDDLLHELYQAQGELFQKNLPLLLDEDTPRYLDELSARDLKLAVVSNTGYMHGDQMRPALDAIGIGQKFDYKVFSNEVGFAKPNSRIFQALVEQSGVSPEHITHIGDNPRADVEGARSMGMHAIHLANGVTLQNIVENSL